MSEIVFDGAVIIPDPRPDLRYDSKEWTQLLSMVHAVDPMAAGTLHGFRCGGLRLHRGAQGYALRPEFDPATSIWSTPEEYAKDRDEWLKPHADVIVKALKVLTEKYDAGRMSA